jgi:uncharacterized protein (TIGR02246 family)
MKKLSVILSIIILMAAITKAQGTKADETAIQQILAHFTSDWNKNDFSDMKDYLTTDCNWVNVVGMRWNGLKEVQFAHQAFANTMFKGVKLETLNSEIHFLLADIAIVYWRSHIGTYYTNQGKIKAGDCDALGTVVVVKQGGKWMIRSTENVDVVAEAVAHDPVLHMPK